MKCDPSGETSKSSTGLDDASFVRSFECFRDLPCDRQRFVQRNCTHGQAIFQRRPVDELHHERVDTVLSFETVNRCDARMVESGQHFRFAPEPGETLRVQSH